MALPELYEQITWHNGTTPAINEDNLNAMSQAIKDIDDRVIEIASTVMEDVPVIEEALEALDPPIRVVKDFAGVQALTDALEKNAVDVKVKVTPKQDLHGYSKPWVDGAGKNKLPLKVSNLKNMNSSGTWSGSVYTKGGLTFSAETNDGENVNAITINGSASERVVLYLNSRFSPSSGQYTLSKTANTSSISMVASAYNNTTWVKALAQFSSGAPTFTIDYDGYDRIEIYIVIQNGTTISNVKFYPQLELGSTATAFEPYTNICPITGFTEAKVTRTGKNLFDVGTSMSDWFLASTNGTIPLDMAGSARVTATVDRATSSVQTTAYINNEYYWPCKAIKLEKNKAYRVTYGSVVNPDRIHLFGRTSGASAGTNIGNLSNGALINSGNYDEWWIGYFPMSSAPRTSFTKMLFRAEDVHDGSFEPYTGTIFTISLGDTRYLAELDVTSGELIVKGTYTTLTSVERLLTNTSGQYRFASNGSYADAKIPSSNTQIATIYSSMFNAISADNTYAEVEGIALHTNRRIFLYSDAWKTKTAAEVNAILTDTPLQIVYELATPVTVQLTATEVALLYTYNTLWADTGDLALTYDASGVLRIANSKLDIDTFKSIVASSSDFADFKSKVAAL